MDRRHFLGAAGLGLAAAACRSPLRAADAPAGRRPNIILILSDDVGIAELSCYGGEHPTPRLDALAGAGIRFEQCYSTPLCGPSRCQLLTGRYPFRTGLNTNQSATAVSPQREVMIPTVMRKAGYVTGSVGKWGQICLGPKEWGFDEWFVFQGSGRYWASQNISYNVSGQSKTLGQKEYLPDLMHDFAVDFTTRHRDKPFMLYYPMSHIHGPIMPTPDSKPGADAKQLYADNISYMDKLVGKLVDHLDRLGLRENTLILFVGDNGTARFGEATIGGKSLSGKKGSMLEGGARVPLLANWPGTTPTGRVNRDLIDFSDFFATCASLGRADLPAGVTLDSQSFAEQLRGEAGKPREWVYVELGGKSYVRDNRYKLTNGGALFDLSKAPFEEIAVPDDTKDTLALASRAKLQAVLDTHRAKPAGGGGGGGGAAGAAGKGKANRPGKAGRRAKGQAAK
ncbi:MAG: sulfatase-like hydrolase/transferase [Armatimonadetes bacterium]|nr:sulfatase-like hydrolase/transferase [Armatimonadota bacterium]